jgi:DNA-binding NarL/FixJ family response regulator
LERVFMKVFIVEDSGVVRKSLKAIFSEIAGVEVIGEAEDAAEAIRQIERTGPDVVTLDIRLRTGSGIDVLRRIRAGGSGLSPVIIVLTNYPYPQYRTACKEAGADFFFDKSTEFERVAGVFAGLVRQGGSMEVAAKSGG